MTALLDTLITQITTIASVTGKNGHIYQDSEVPNIVLVRVGDTTEEFAVANGDESYHDERFTLTCYSTTAALLDTLINSVRDKIHSYATSNLRWLIDGSDEPMISELRAIRTLRGKQVKVES